MSSSRFKRISPKRMFKVQWIKMLSSSQGCRKRNKKNNNSKGRSVELVDLKNRYNFQVRIQVAVEDKPFKGSKLLLQVEEVDKVVEKEEGVCKDNKLEQLHNHRVKGDNRLCLEVRLLLKVEQAAKVLKTNL